MYIGYLPSDRLARQRPLQQFFQGTSLLNVKASRYFYEKKKKTFGNPKSSAVARDGVHVKKSRARKILQTVQFFRLEYT